MCEAADFNWDFGELSSWVCVIGVLIRLGTQANELIKARGGAENDSSDQEPGFGA